MVGGRWAASPLPRIQEGPATLHPALNHASAVTPSGLLLVGGDGNPQGTQLLENEEFVEWFQLATWRRWFCSIQVSETAMVVTGGVDVECSVTEYTGIEVDLGAGPGASRQLPDMTVCRWQHACGSYYRGAQQVAPSTLLPRCCW